MIKIIVDVNRQAIRNKSGYLHALRFDFIDLNGQYRGLQIRMYSPGQYADHDKLQEEESLKKIKHIIISQLDISGKIRQNYQKLQTIDIGDPYQHQSIIRNVERLNKLSESIELNIKEQPDYDSNCII